MQTAKLITTNWAVIQSIGLRIRHNYLRRGPETVVIGQRLNSSGSGCRNIAALVAKIDANHGHFLLDSLSSDRCSK